ncbi:MAG: Gfo/Idh/MocA family protein [Bacillota bacterium]
MTQQTLDYAPRAGRRIKSMAAPKLAYEPCDPRKYWPNIGLIGCGTITEDHLSAYQAAGYKVVALCDLIRQRAEQRREQFFPNADIYTDYRRILERDDIEVVDIATHPAERLPIIQEAILAKKHVLSQKPFVLNLDTGQKLVDLARKQRVKLAVNQNARWAPHFSYIRNAIADGLIGKVMGVHLSRHWDLNRIKGTRFDELPHVILYDVAIHWFDILTCFMSGQVAKRVYASSTHAMDQDAKQPLLAQAVVEYDHSQATLAFDGNTRFGVQDHTLVSGTDGTISAQETCTSPMELRLCTARGLATPKLRGAWFPDGFHGTMGELLCAIEQNREPDNSAENNLRSLALSFAAIKAAETGKPQIPGKVRRLPV